MFRPIVTILTATCLLMGCGNDNSERNLRKKMVADSIERVDSIAKNKVANDNLKLSLADSIQAAKEFELQVAKYDSLRLADSLKLKWNKRRWKDRDAIKPAPKRELWAKSPIRAY